MSLADVIRQLDDSSRRKLEKKLPSWAGVGVTVPAAINLEQCSGESAARYKASLIAPGARVADLTGGLGADSWAFSLRASAVWYNERNTDLLDAVRSNFSLLGVRNAEFSNFDITPQDTAWSDALAAFGPDVVYLDPARRSSTGSKVFLLEDCSPDVTAVLPGLLGIAPTVIIKVSPMADITMLRRRLADSLCELHIVGAGGECKELLCVCRRNVTPYRQILAEDGAVFDPQRPCEPGALLFVPSAAMVKAALGPIPASVPLDARTGFCRAGYSEYLSHFGSFYKILEDLPFASSLLKGIGLKYPAAEVTAKSVPISSEDLRKKMRTKPGGPVHIFASPVKGERRILVCQKVTAPEQMV